MTLDVKLNKILRHSKLSLLRQKKSLPSTILSSWNYFSFWLMMGRKRKLKRVFHFRVGKTVKLKGLGIISCAWQEEKNSHGLPAKGWLQSLIAPPELGCLATILIWPEQASQETWSDPPAKDLCPSVPVRLPQPVWAETSGMNWTGVIQT